MKKMMLWSLLLLLAALLLTGCAKEAEQETVTMIGNPWKDFASLLEAESHIGFSLDLPEVIADSWTAETFRAMKGAAEVLEVRYRDGETTVTVRKSPGEGQDIAGVYGYDAAEECLLPTGEPYTVCRQAESGSEAFYVTLDRDGYSWSVYAPDGCWGDSLEDFLLAICGEHE